MDNSNLSSLTAQLVSNYFALENAKKNYRKALKSSNNNKLNDIRGQRTKLVKIRKELETEISMLVIPEEFKHWKSLKVKKVYLRSEGNLHIYYGPSNALCEGHGHCIIHLIKNDIIYDRPFGEGHGQQNYKKH